MGRPRKVEPGNNPLDNLRYLVQEMAVPTALSRCTSLLAILADHEIVTRQGEEAPLLEYLLRLNPIGRSPSRHVLAGRDLIYLTDRSAEEVRELTMTPKGAERDIHNKETREILASARFGIGPKTFRMRHEQDCLAALLATFREAVEEEARRRLSSQVATEDNAEDADQIAADQIAKRFERLLSTNPGAASWLAIFAYFSPSEPISFALLEDGVQPCLPWIFRRLDERPLTRYVDELLASDFVRSVAPGVIAVSAVTASTIIRELSEVARERAAHTATVLLWEAFQWNIFDQANWSRGGGLVAHVVSVAEHCDSIPLARPNAVVLMCRASNYYRARAEHTRAIQLGRRAVAMAERTRDARKQVDAMTVLAQALTEKNELDEAQALLIRAMRMEVEAGLPALSRAETRNLYAHLLCRMGRFKDAEKAQWEALFMFAHDNRPEQYWQICNDLAMTLHYRGLSTRALDLLYSTRHSVNGRDTERIALANIGRVLLALDKPRDAKGALQEALALHAGWTPIDGRRLKKTLEYLLEAHIALGEDAEAKAVRRRIADIDAPWLT